MILAQGKLYDTAEQERILAGLGAEIARTRMEKTLDTEIVVAALDKLGQLAEAGAFDARLAALELDNSDVLVKTAASMLRRESVACKLRVELGAD